jgi:hypothetical protein
LEPEIKDDVPVVAGDEVGVVVVPALEVNEVRRRGMVLVELERRGVDGDGLGVDALLVNEVVPDEDGRRLPLQERPLGVILLERVALDDVRPTHVDGLGRQRQSERRHGLVGIGHIGEEVVDRLLHLRLVPAKENLALHEPGVDDIAALDIRGEVGVGPPEVVLEVVGDPRNCLRELRRRRCQKHGVRLQLHEKTGLLIGEIVCLVVHDDERPAKRRVRHPVLEGIPRRLIGVVDVAAEKPEAALVPALLVEGADGG